MCPNTERKDIIIRMNGQSECGHMIFEDSRIDKTILQLTAEGQVCGSRGCEENEQHEPLVNPCTCNGGLGATHPACIDTLPTTSTTKICKKQADNSCEVYGGNDTVFKDGLLSDTQGKTGASDNGRSILVDPSLSSRKKVTDVNPNGRSVKRIRSGIPSGEPAGEKQLPLKSAKEESAAQVVQITQKNDMPVSESEKLGVGVLTRRFSDAVVSVPIKKRKFNLICEPSPPGSPSPEHAELRTLTEVSTLETLHDQLNGDEQQRVLENVDIAEASQQDFGVTDKSESRSVQRSIVEFPSSLVSWSGTSVNNADFSGISMLAAAACTDDHGNVADDKEDVVAKIRSPTSDGVKSDLLFQDDMEIDSTEKLERDVVMDSEIQGRERNEELHIMPKAVQALTLEDDRVNKQEKHICPGESEQNHIYMGPPTELGLGINHSEGSGILNITNDTNTIGLGLVKEKEEHKGLRLSSAYSRDDRSHWDLNTMMDKWESPTNEHSANPEQVSCIKILVETANNNIGISDESQIHTAVSESKSYPGCSEQYMLCKGFDEKQNEQEMKESKESIPHFRFDNCTGSTISLGLKLDTSARNQPNHIDELNVCESSTSSNGPADGSGSINSLNLSVAPLKQFFNSAKNVCEEHDCSIQHKTTTANEVLEMHAEVKTANCQDILIPEAGTSNKAEEGIDHLKDPSEIAIQEVNSAHKTEISSPKCLLEHSKDHSDVSNGIKDQKGDTSPESGHGNFENESHFLLSTVVEEKFPVETATTKSDRGDTFAAVDQSLFKVNDTMVTEVKITSQNDVTMPLVDTVCKADTTISLLASTCKVDEPGMENKNVCKVDSLLSFGESVSQVEAPVVADLNACKVDAPILNAETVREFDPTAVKLSVCRVDVSITVNESISIGSDPMAVDGSVLKVESLEATDEKWGKIGSPVAMKESFYNVEDSEADDQNVNMACSSVSIGESACKFDVSEAVVDKSTPNDMSKNMEDIVEDPSGEMAPEVACDCDYDYDVLDEEEEPLSNTEKVDKERMNDESQYEDGEYRETNSGDWVEDMAEDLEVEHVDYGYFDCRDADELVSYDAFSMPYQAESEHKGEDQADIESIDEHERNLDYSQQDLTEDTMANTHCNQGHPTAPESTKDASEHRDPKHETKLVKLLGQNNQITESKVHLDQHEDVESGDARHPSLSRQKSSGWDQLPEGFINAEEAMKSAKDSSEKRVQGAVWAVPNGRDSLGRIGSMSGRPLERARPGDLVHGRERVYIQESRDGSFDSSPRFFSRATGRGRNSGRGGSLNGVQGRGRGDPWMDSPTGQWGTRGHHSPGYYGSPVRFGNLGHSNAAVVSAAKLESSGFAVAPDGTLVKLDGAGPTTRGMRPLRGVGRSGRGTVMGRGSSADEGNMHYRMQMGMGPGRRANMSPDRVMKVGRSRGGFGSDVVGLPRRGGPERYGGRLIGNSSLDSLRRSMQSVDFRMTRRDRSFSPPLRRRSPPLRRGSPPNTSCSRTKSYSRSRTRSPHMRSSPRGRVFSGMEGGSGYSRHSRSPTIRPEPRLERLRSPPSHRVGISGHTTSLIPSSRSQCSPSQASRWSSYNRDTEHERSHDYKRHFASTRNLPGRISPQSDRKSGFMDSPVRQKHNEYSRHIYSGRSDKPSNYVRRSRHEDNDNVKWKNYRYETLHSGRSVDVSNNVRRMLDEEEDGPRIHSSCSKEASELQGRGSPIVDEKEREKKAGSTSRRENRKEDRSHLKYNRDGRPRGNIRSLGTHEIDDDVAPRRRRPS